MLKLKSKYEGTVFHSINELSADIIYELKENNPEFIYEFFEEV
tara:strand:- start:421 stop:549 length:129 start_codon:yes stop_codon:yes gene_type:complete